LLTIGKSPAERLEEQTSEDGVSEQQRMNYHVFPVVHVQQADSAQERRRGGNEA
jgi:hypothetical protein